MRKAICQRCLHLYPVRIFSRRTRTFCSEKCRKRAERARARHRQKRKRPMTMKNNLPLGTTEREALELMGKARDWVDELIAAGMREDVAVSSIMLSLIERALSRGGVPETAHWLRSLAVGVEQNGAAMLGRRN